MAPVPLILYRKSFFHLWNSSEFLFYANEETFQLITLILKNNDLTIHVLEILLGDIKSFRSYPVLKYIPQIKEKRLLYVGWYHFTDDNLFDPPPYQSEWTCYFHSESIINHYKREASQILFEDNHMCVVHR